MILVTGWPVSMLRTSQAPMAMAKVDMGTGKLRWQKWWRVRPPDRVCSSAFSPVQRTT